MRKVLALLLLCGGCAGDARFNKVWSGLESTITSPTRVEAFRITASKPDMDYLKWAETAGPILLDGPTSKELAGILLDSKGYYRGPPKACIPTPGVKLRFTPANGTTVWVYLCFECRILIVYEGQSLRGSDDFDPAAPALAALVKKLFPKDPEIQALK